MPEESAPPEAPVADVTSDVEDDVVVVPDDGRFTVRLDNFTGPFDLLLQLIGKHKLDVTEIALHQVTDDFIVYLRAMGDDWDLGETSEFLLVAATLLDLKAARLLPSAEVEDEEDLALLEARDLLFARLLQYKAYKEAAAWLAELEGTGAKRWPRAVSMEPRYAEALPDLVLGVGAERLFKLALKQFLPKPGPPQVSTAHIHQVRVSVREHATLLRDRLRRAGSATFSLLIADCENTLEVVARFLALLELYREGLIEFEQPVSLDELTVRWVGGADAADIDLDIDDYEGSKPEIDTAATDPAEVIVTTAPDAVGRADLDGVGRADSDGVGRGDSDGVGRVGPDGVGRADSDGVGRVGPDGVGRADPDGVWPVDPDAVDEADVDWGSDDDPDPDDDDDDDDFEDDPDAVREPRAYLRLGAAATSVAVGEPEDLATVTVAAAEPADSDDDGSGISGAMRSDPAPAGAAGPGDRRDPGGDDNDEADALEERS